MNILIFGVTGNSGRELAKYYLSKNANVYGVGRKDKLEGMPDVAYIQGDICDTNLFSQLPSAIDLVVNFAGVQPSIMKTSENTDLYATLREYVNVNMLGSYNVLEWISKSKVGTYIYATTHRDYENYWSNSKELKNDMPPAINYQGDHSMYAISKVVGRMMGDYMLPLKNIRCFNLRLPMMFLIPERPYFLSNGQDKMMPFLKIIKDAIDGKSLEIWGDPNMPRDYVYIDNLMSMIDKCYSSSLAGGTFSVGTGEGVTTESFVKAIGVVFSPSKEVDYIYRPENKTFKSAVYDISEQKELLDYSPIMLREMLEIMKKKIYAEDYLSKWGWTK